MSNNKEMQIKTSMRPQNCRTYYDVKDVWKEVLLLMAGKNHQILECIYTFILVH